MGAAKSILLLKNFLLDILLSLSAGFPLVGYAIPGWSGPAAAF